MNDINQQAPRPVNYDRIIRQHLKKAYPKLSERETAVLSREIIFAPAHYNVPLNDKPTPIASVRENLADTIERHAATENFIPYSLDAEIADLIEQSNCETSSMNEYYRWVSATYDILRHTQDGEITDEDLSERKTFITLSYDREAELLLCLSLYEGAGLAHNQEKVNLLRFKLARLRELRSIVKNTADHTTHKHKLHNLEAYCQYCAELMQKDIHQPLNLNLKLNLDIEHSNDEDLDENYSHLSRLREMILLMMRLLELPVEQNQRVNPQTLTPAEQLNIKSTSERQRS